MENKNTWEIGDVVDKELYTSAAIYCNKKGDRHIEKKDGVYIVVANEIYVPTKQEILMQKEAEYGMNRAMREVILASGCSDFIKERAEELESLAKEIRNEDGWKEAEELAEEYAKDSEEQEEL